MSSIIELFIFSLLVFIPNLFAFNETCGKDKPMCPNPLQCYGGYCLCSDIATTTSEKSPLSFWTGEECMTCPLHYTTTGTKCYYLIMSVWHQLTWEGARERCRQHGGDLLVFRSEQEVEYITDDPKVPYKLITNVVRGHGKETEMFQRVPQDGTYFGSVWIGAKLEDWSGEGSYHLVSHGPPLTKRNQYWCSQASPLRKEPNYVEIKATGERQACIALAFFKDGSICLHDWFCSWTTHTLCEIHPPPPTTTADPEIEALEEKSSNTWVYMGVGGIILLLVSASICAFCFLCNKKKTGRRARSFDSAESGMSQNSFF